MKFFLFCVLDIYLPFRYNDIKELIVEFKTRRYYGVENMFKRKFTAVTQLHEKNNQNIIDYIESARGTYAQSLRKTFYVGKNSPDFDKSRYNTHLQETYGILKRTANSIIADAQGRLNALKELKAYEQKQLTRKIKSLESKIEEPVHPM